MTKIKKLSIIIFTILACCLLSLGMSTTAFASTGNETETEGEATPRLFTSLSLSIDGGNGQVWATVRNDFTLFPSTVIVIVELYSSTTYYESYTNMDLVSKNNIDDLNIYQSISTYASTGGVQKYWHARMRYKIDSGAWETKTTGTLTFDANGNYIGYN